ncbi:MAG TPA: hypothetical protein VMT53_27530 [Terriglobales bacterium]|nr:hypothetical protein [Terriglobales bacterium]
MKAHTLLRPYVMDELECEPTVDAAKVGMIAKDSIVILTAKRAAVSTATRHPRLTEASGSIKTCLYASAISIAFADGRLGRGVGDAMTYEEIFNPHLGGSPRPIELGQRPASTSYATPGISDCVGISNCLLRRITDVIFAHD